MAKIKFGALLDSLSLVTFEFLKPQITVTGEGDKVVVLPLVTPLENVNGSQRVPDDTGALHTVFAESVREIRVHERDYKAHEDSFEWDDVLEVGTYKGTELMLDVAKRSQDVWLTGTSFASAGNSFRAENQRKSFSRYIPAGNKNDAGNAGGKGPVVTNEEPVADGKKGK